MHSIALLVVVASPVGEQLADARQMHASYMIVQAPELCAVHMVTSMTELLYAAAVMLGMVVGTVIAATERSSKNMACAHGELANSIVLDVSFSPFFS